MDFIDWLAYTCGLYGRWSTVHVVVAVAVSIHSYVFFLSVKMDEMAYGYVDEHLISPSLLCPICLDILQEPHTHITCDSAFCRSCLLQLAEPFCPICRWTWNGAMPLDYNIYLPKASRLIRNMLDDLRVKCAYCHTVRRRGQFEHQCEPMNEALTRKSHPPPSPPAQGGRFRGVLFGLVVILWMTVTYYSRTNLFQPVVDQPQSIIQDTAVNIDRFLLGKFSDLIICLLEYSMGAFITSMLIWLSIKLFGERYVSKSASRLLENVFETSIILNLILYSFYNEWQFSWGETIRIGERHSNVIEYIAIFSQ